MNQVTSPIQSTTSPSEGITVQEFKPVVSKMFVNTYNYILFSIKNNVKGSSAKGIEVSLENLEPFKVYECGKDHAPDEVRTTICNQFFNDVDLPYNTHFVDRMLPNEELQFFWNIHAPSSYEIGNMPYTHTIYYVLKYNYTTEITQSIVVITQEEYLNKNKEGKVTLVGKTLSSPGELKLISKTQQPIIYLPGGKTDFALEFKLSNKGDGIVSPGTDIIIGLQKDPRTSVKSGEEYGWVKYGDNALSKLFDFFFPLEEYPSIDRKNLWVYRIPSSEFLNNEYSLVLPVEYDAANTYEPQSILTFNVYISYTYMKEGQTKISVYPQ